MKKILLKILKMIIITTVIWFSYLNLVTPKEETIFTKESWEWLGVIYVFFIIRIIFQGNKEKSDSV